MEREELLQNLYYARGIIEQAETITQSYNNLKSQLIEEKKFVKVEDRKPTLFRRSRKINESAANKRIYIITGVFAVMCIWVLIEGIKNAGFSLMALFQAIAYPLLLFVALKLLLFWRKKRNSIENNIREKKVNKFNESIAESNEIISEQISIVNREMQEIRQLADEELYWYPRNYCYSDAVNYFINVVSNYRADSLKEAINLYVEELRHRQMMQNQQELVRQQKINNVLSTANLFANLSTASAINQNTTAINNQTSAMNRNATKLNDTIKGTGQRIINNLKK